MGTIWILSILSSFLTSVAESGTVSKVLGSKLLFLGNKKGLSLANLVLLMISTGLYATAISKNTFGQNPLIHPTLIVVVWSVINYACLFLLPALWGDYFIKTRMVLIYLALFSVSGGAMLY